MLMHMHVPRPTGRSRRRGATIVEAALVLSVFLLLLFGIFEYCRFLFVLHVTNNAAREGARYASVNVSNSSVTSANVVSYTTQMMSNAQGNISGYTVNVFAADPAGLSSNPPVIQSWSAASAWNNTSFPNSVAVQITGNYVPVLPTFLFMPSTIPISITAVMIVE